MSRDPYIDVKREVEQSLSTLQSLLSSHSRLQSSSTSSSSPELLEAEDELRNTLSNLEGDLEDLEESVTVVEGMGDKWGIGAGEVRRRREFVEGVKRDVDGLRGMVYNKGKKKGKGKGKEAIRSDGRYRDDPGDLERGREDPDEVRRWEAEEQQMLVQRQDDTLGVISGTLHNLASQAGLIGQEVHVQGEMLDDLSTRVDNTDNRLRKVQRTMTDFIRRNEETKSGWCIAILIVILIILLMLVIIT
ncbi:hypothetical protein CI109_106571 [Kwoniella shandongensis]|uniref:Uncharacterized protein n=1 Tax=Kwoniella shandongensis TaxID=1734106 RepID=A0A5M6C1V4_9TREE|nr:uncharacterized protein CI109_002752 [Kwoniella shandongensis]KAA5528994.1 hypothetical protein CI109_002752 [Kwoniella shandongensis]